MFSLRDRCTFLLFICVVLFKKLPLIFNIFKMSQELFYDKGLKKWRTYDSETGEIGGVVREVEPYFLSNIQGTKDLSSLLTMSELGFFFMLLGFLEYRNRICVSYRFLIMRYKIGSATIKRHFDKLKEYNIIIEQPGKRGRNVFIVNGRYVFRGNGKQLEENREMFEKNDQKLKKREKYKDDVL